MERRVSWRFVDCLWRFIDCRVTTGEKKRGKIRTVSGALSRGAKKLVRKFRISWKWSGRSGQGEFCLWSDLFSSTVSPS